MVMKFVETRSVRVSDISLEELEAEAKRQEREKKEEPIMQKTPGHKKYICYTPRCGTVLWSPVRPKCCPKCKKVSHERDRLKNADTIMFPGLGRKREAVPVAPVQLSKRARRRRRTR